MIEATTANPALDTEYDLVIVGSGGGSMAAALVAKRLGKTPVILEKMDKVGGSTSFSGGVWWIPNNQMLAEAGIHDSYENARRYYDSVVTHHGPGVTPQRRDSFLKAAPRMMEFLKGLGLKFRRPVDDWPDYYDDRPGGRFCPPRSTCTSLASGSTISPCIRLCLRYPLPRTNFRQCS